MGNEIDFKKIAKYPPEIFVQAYPSSLNAGTNTVLSYVGINRTPFILTLYGLSFASLSGAKFTLDVDENTNIFRIYLDAVKGISGEEELKVPAYNRLIARITDVSAGVSAYQWRHKIKVDKATTLLKLLIDAPLTPRDKELIEKYNLRELLAINDIPPYNPYRGIYKIYTISRSYTSSGLIARLPVPKNHKLVLLDISENTAGSSGTAYIDITRDYIDILRIDPYCLPGISNMIGLDYRYNLHIVALEELLIELTVNSGTHNIRVVYGLSKITIPEKIRWGLDLTSKELTIAEKHDLFDKVEAGLI